MEYENKGDIQPAAPFSELLSAVGAAVASLFKCTFEFTSQPGGIKATRGSDADI